MPPESEMEMSNISIDLREKLGRGDCFFVDDGPNFSLDPNNPVSETPLRMHEHHVLGSCSSLFYSPIFPGDLVFFPARWFHYFHNVTSTVSVTIQSINVA